MTVPGSTDEGALGLGRSIFREEWFPTIEARANGRIEVIGNHIDYSGGPVLAAAIDRGITVLASETLTGLIRAGFPDLDDDGPESLHPDELRDWRATTDDGPANYLRGVIAEALDRGLTIRPGLDLVVHGDIPVGGGVSSSAALCVALTLVVVEELLPKPDLVRLAQQAEHRAGTPCGTMDQSASVFGGLVLFGGSPDHVTRVPIDLAGHRFVVLGSGVQRSLSTSAYADRVDESQRALDALRSSTQRSIEALADVSLEELHRADAAGAFEGQPTIYLRARHVVTEVQRVRSALTALEAADWKAFGRLMTASGQSSATDYDISHPAVEALVVHARRVPGVLGARMMGGGEGGNALALVAEPQIRTLVEELTRTYYRHNDLDADTLIFVCRIGEAASVRLGDRE